jgi:hypothetical protein
MPLAGWRRRVLAAGGFPASWLLAGPAASIPAWTWALAALPLLMAYPLRAWRDAPLFPTPAGALDALSGRLTLPPRASLLDAGCGLGHGLEALRSAWPDARIEGVEASLPLAWACRWRCRWARIHRGDLWGHDWGGHDLVYLFQRPESMPRAAAKARAEMRPGAWLVSLEFPVPGWTPGHRVALDPRRTLWAYRIGPEPAARSTGAGPRR